MIRFSAAFGSDEFCARAVPVEIMNKHATRNIRHIETIRPSAGAHSENVKHQLATRERQI